MKTLIAAAFAAALIVGVGAPVVAPTPAQAAVAIVVGGKLGGGVVVGRTRVCRHWANNRGRRACSRWGWRHRVKHCNRWRMHNGRRGACIGWRYRVVWR